MVAASDMPDLYTLRALRALNEADAIVLTERVEDSALEPARRDATRIRIADADAAALRVLELAKDGARVVFMQDGAGSPSATAWLQRACKEIAITCRDVPKAG